MPAVSFLKAAKPQTGHPSDSTPLAEQQFLVQTINALQRLPEWNDITRPAQPEGPGALAKIPRLCYICCGEKLSPNARTRGLFAFLGLALPL